MRYFTFLFSEDFVSLLKYMLDFSLVVTDLKADLLVFLGDRVKHANLELAIRWLRVIPLLSDSPYYLLAFMHLLDSDLHQVLLIHFDEIHPCHVIPLDNLSYFLCASSILLWIEYFNDEHCDLSTAPLHYVPHLGLWWWCSWALLIFLVLCWTVDRLVAIGSGSGHHRRNSSVLIFVLLQSYPGGECLGALRVVWLGHL